MSKQTIKINESKLRNIIKENIKKALTEGYAYNPRTYNREKQYEFSINDIKRLVNTLQDSPIEDNQVIDLDFCKVRRVSSSSMSGGVSYLGDNNYYKNGNNGEIYIQIGRQNNTPWYEENGYTYMAWKYPSY